MNDAVAALHFHRGGVNKNTLYVLTWICLILKKICIFFLTIEAIQGPFTNTTIEL